VTGRARPILRWPDRCLAAEAAPVGAVDDAIRAIWEDMIDTMERMGETGASHGPGLGLAAPQIGVLRRLAVVDASRERGRAVRLADPEIVEAAEEMRTETEGSPCLPGLSAPVARPDWVVVAFTDAEGGRVRERFEGLWATSVQHQIDHLAGRLFVDRLSKLRRDRLLKRAQKARSHGAAERSSRGQPQRQPQGQPKGQPQRQSQGHSRGQRTGQGPARGEAQ
jgi:peptide deformylase